MIKFTIVVLSRNRPKYLNNCIKSILSQSIKFDKIIVSDNSNNKSKIKAIEFKYFDQINFVYRGGKLNMFEHFRVNFNETKSQYLVIIHDDDYLNKNYLYNINKFISKHPDFSLVGTNGFYFEDKNLKSKRIFNLNKNLKYFKVHSNLLLNRYLDYDLGGVAPFSTYLYNLSHFKKNNIILPDLSRCRFIDDAYFLIDSAHKLNMFWINIDLSYIRRHFQSATTYSLLDYRLFITKISRHDSYNKNTYLNIKKFRFFSFLSNRKKITRNNIIVYIKILCFLLVYSSYFRKLLIKKIFIK